MEMAQRMQMPRGGDAAGELPLTFCKPPSQGDAWLKALTSKLPLGENAPAPPGPLADAPHMPPLADAVVPRMHAIEDAAATVASGAVAPGAVAPGAVAPAVVASGGAVASGGKNDLSALTAKILAARIGVKGDRAQALRACMHL